MRCSSCPAPDAHAVADDLALCTACLRAAGRIALVEGRPPIDPTATHLAASAATFGDPAQAFADLADAFDAMGMSDDAARAASEALTRGIAEPTAPGRIVVRWLAPTAERRRELRRRIETSRAAN